MPRFVAVYLLPAVVSHDIAATDPPFLSISLHLFLCEKNVMRKKEDFWHSSVKIFTQLLSAECVNEPRQRTATKDEERRRRSEEGRRMTDIPVRHCAASLRGSSKWDHHQPQQQLPHLMPCSSAPSPPPASLLLLRFPQLLVIILFAEQTLTKVF